MRRVGSSVVDKKTEDVMFTLPSSIRTGKRKQRKLTTHTSRVKRWPQGGRLQRTQLRL